MRLIIIRHGDPDYDIDSLTEKGFREAALLSERLKKLDISKIYCSPLGRAKDTAKPTLEKLGADMEILDWLEEFPRSTYRSDGTLRRAWDQMPKLWTNDETYFDKDNWIKGAIFKNTETENLYKNICQKFDELLEKHGYKRENNLYRAIKPNHDTVVLFCHFGLECVLLSRILNISPMCLWHGFVALPSSVTTLITEEREEGYAYFRCNAFGDISHLYAGDEPPAFAARFCEEFSNTEERH